MPGERLMCVWGAAYSLSRETRLTKEALRDVVVSLDSLPGIHFSRSSFDKAFATVQDINIANFKRYLFDSLAEEGAAQCYVQESVENECWEISKKFYSSKTLNDSNLKKLWEICNRLVEPDSYPPQITSDVVDWLVDKACSRLNKFWKGKTKTMGFPSYNFCSLVDRLVDDLFLEETEMVIDECIDTLHKWLVLEIMNSGWLLKRTRKGANTTNWVKRWFVLSATRLCYYATEKPGSKPRGTVFITGSEVEMMPPFKSLFRTIPLRFRLSRGPRNELQMGSDQACKRRGWISCLQEAIDASKHNTTPIQRLLKERNWGPATEKLLLALNPEEQCLDTVQNTSPEELRKNSVTQSKNPHPANGDELFDNPVDSRVINQHSEKLKAVFMTIDSDGDGKINAKEFKEFVLGLCLDLNVVEINLLFRSIAQTNNAYITFQEFCEYVENIILDKGKFGEVEARLQEAFLQADRNGTGSLNFRQFSEYVRETGRSMRIDQLLTTFDEMDIEQKDQVSYGQFQRFYKRQMSALPETECDVHDRKVESLNAFCSNIRESYTRADSEALAAFVHERWEKFATLRRTGASGRPVMTGAHGMVSDILPGDYTLLDLVCFTDLPSAVPRHTAVKGVKWETGVRPGTSGKLLFPRDFDGVLAWDTATPEHLRYYGCSFAEGNQRKVSLLYRHGIQDFTYQEHYLDDYVMEKNGGAGLEKHAFSHLDCPLEEDSGFFIVGKLIDSDEIHLTAFQVPIRHTLYIPPMVIHSNDYLRGTWRTMLSDEADIDHVHLVRATSRNELNRFKFKISS